MKLFNTLALSFLAFAFFADCKGQANLTFCKQNYKTAREYLNKYYALNQDSFLLISLYSANNAIICPETKNGAIEIKIGDLILLKKFTAGYKFVDSLKDDDFDKPYQRLMCLNKFLALNATEKFDTTKSKQYYLQILPSIQEYIQRIAKTNDKIREEAYYDLFVVKSKIETVDEIVKEINALKSQFPKESRYWDMLQGTFSELKTALPK